MEKAAHKGECLSYKCDYEAVYKREMDFQKEWAHKPHKVSSVFLGCIHLFITDGFSAMTQMNTKTWKRDHIFILVNVELCMDVLGTRKVVGAVSSNLLSTR